MVVRMRPARLHCLVLATLPLLLLGYGQSQRDVVIAYNSPEQWANWGGVLDAFTEATGIEAPNDSKNSGQTLAALQAEAANPQADTAYYGIVFGIQAKEADLVEAYQPPGFDEIPDELKDPEGYWFTAHQGAIAFLVNTEELGGAPIPQCWSDLADPAYEGLVGFLDPTQAAVGYSVVVAANLALGGSLDNFDPAIQYFQELDRNGLILPAQTATALVQQGEIPILIDADFNGYKLANIDEAPVKVVIPCEGSLAIPYVMSLVKDAPRPENGKALLDFVLSDEGQQLFVESYLRPVRDVEVAPEIADSMLPPSDYDRVTGTDFAAMQEAQEAFIKRWSNEVRR
jgi:putative spermidine/putrescine transport system substrate-binding protein